MNKLVFNDRSIISSFIILVRKLYITVSIFRILPKIISFVGYKNKIKWGLNVVKVKDITTSVRNEIDNVLINFSTEDFNDFNAGNDLFFNSDQFVDKNDNNVFDGDDDLYNDYNGNGQFDSAVLYDTGNLEDYQINIVKVQINH